MKKLLLCTLASLFITNIALAATDSIQFTVDETKKAEVERQIATYQKLAKETISKAEKEIKDAQNYFESVKKNAEKTIADSKMTITKAQAEASQAQETFERVKKETNDKITAANEKIKRANEELKANLARVQQVNEKK